MTASLLRFELQNAGVSAATVEAEVMIGIFTIESLLMHATTKAQRAICDRLSARWLLNRTR